MHIRTRIVPYDRKNVVRLQIMQTLLRPIVYEQGVIFIEPLKNSHEKPFLNDLQLQLLGTLRIIELRAVLCPHAIIVFL